LIEYRLIRQRIPQTPDGQGGLRGRFWDELVVHEASESEDLDDGNC
jgi:hypothetical protein